MTALRALVQQQSSLLNLLRNSHREVLDPYTFYQTAATLLGLATEEETEEAEEQQLQQAVANSELPQPPTLSTLAYRAEVLELASAKGAVFDSNAGMNGHDGQWCFLCGGDSVSPPVRLGCGHLMCLSCIELQMQAASRIEQVRHLVCPYGRTCKGTSQDLKALILQSEELFWPAWKAEMRAAQAKVRHDVAVEAVSRDLTVFFS